MKKCLFLIQFALVLGFGSGCIIVPPPHHQHGPATVPHPTPAPPPRVVVRQPTPRPAPPPQVVAVRTSQERWVQVTLDPREREVIREYIVYKKNGHSHGHGKGHNKGLPKGLAKKAERGETLPPGWQKKCVRGQTMPMEVFKYCQPLPHEVIVKLPPPPPGTVIVTLEGKAVRLVQATLEILDVFDVI
jgi:hypothetical protein